MNDQLRRPRLVFQCDFDERAAFEAESRGFLSHVAVELDDGSRYPVIFYDPVRLQQEIDDSIKAGRVCFADPGMIVVPELTLECMNRAVLQLVREGFFSHLKPLQTLPPGSTCSIYQWPPVRREPEVSA